MMVSTMGMHTFYSEELGVGRLELNPEEASHCVRVLRLRAGERIRLVDGRGGVGYGVLESAGSGGVLVGVDSLHRVARTFCEENWIAFAPPKSTDRIEWLVEKLVEVGVGRIIPFVSSRSERRTLKVERLERIALAALKQCLGAYLPVIDPLLSWAALIDQMRRYQGELFVAHLPLQGEPPLLSNIRLDAPCCVMVGPEGGFAEEEVREVGEAGGTLVSLGTRRLRVETAALTACLLAGMRM